MSVTVHVDLPGGTTVRAGTLTDQRDRSGQVLVATTFRYDDDYLARRDAYALSPTLPLVRSTLSSQPGTLDGAFDDTLPDRWGRRLLWNAEARAARRDGRAPASLDDLHLLLHTRDDTRPGALRYSLDDGRTFMSDRVRGVPELVDLPALLTAARGLSVDDVTDDELAALVAAGTSMGGMRPKVTVRLGDGRLALAKLPDRSDRWDVLAWEATALRLAADAGVRTSPFVLHRTDPESAILVVERFDRRRRVDGSTERIGYLSARTLTEAGAGDTVTYEDVADALLTGSSEARRDQRELFRRVALTVLVNNVDDHLKNHGVLRGRAGWQLSPVFDVNPWLDARVVAGTPLSDRDDGTRRDVRHLVETRDAYGLTLDAARALVAEVAHAVARWAEVATERGLDAEARERGAIAFDSDNLRWARALSTDPLPGPSSAPSGPVAPTG